MITREKSIERVLAKEPKPGRPYAVITNEELLGVRPNGELEEAGVDLLARGRRREIEEELECLHGVGLIPHDYHGSFRRVPVEMKAAYIILHRVRRLAVLVGAQEDGDSSSLRLTVENYETNPHVPDDFCKVLASTTRMITAFEALAMEALQPKIARLELLLLPYMQKDDDDGL